MIDREYVKLNTSIQTGSNAQTLRYDDDGNVEATIELRLPDNVFGGSPSTKKIEKVAMQTSKMRLSMEQTPIAELPLDTDLSTDTLIASTCKLDVYPFCLLDNNKIVPDPAVGGMTAFPFYKDHTVHFVIRLFTKAVLGEEQFTILQELDTRANTDGYMFPESSRFYDSMKKGGVGMLDNHLMNLCAQSNHEPYQIEGDQLFIKHIGTLEQMLQDALENAITYASTSDHQTVYIDYIDAQYVDENPDGLVFDPPVQTDNSMILEETNTKIYYWKWEQNANESTSSCKLKFACKPIVKLKEQSLTISYDSSAFDTVIPIIWNTPFVNTYDQPEQMTIDTLRNEVWHEPPPKRMYKYGAAVAEDHTYQYTILNVLNCAAMNIIGNKAMRDTFSFLPWIRLDTTKLTVFDEGRAEYSVKKTKDVTTSDTITHTETLVGNHAVPYAYWDRLHVVSTDYGEINVGITYSFSAYDEDGGANAPAHRRFYQVLEVSNIDQAIYFDPPVPFSDHSDLVTSTTQTVLPPVRTSDVIDEYNTYEELTPGSRVISSTSETSESSTSSVEPVVVDYSFVSPTIYYLNINGENKWVLGEPTIGSWGGNNAGTLSRSCGWVPPLDQMQGPQEVSLNEGTNPDEFPVVSGAHKRYSYYCELAFALDTTVPNVAYALTDIQTPGDPTFRSITNTTETTVVTTITQTIEEIRPFVPEASVRDQVLPNIGLSNDSFYILDGTTAEVSIGPQELIRGSTTSGYLFQIDELKEYTKYEGSVTSSFFYTAVDENDFPLECVAMGEKVQRIPIDDVPFIHIPFSNYIWCEFMVDMMIAMDYEHYSTADLIQRGTNIYICCTEVQYQIPRETALPPVKIDMSYTPRHEVQPPPNETTQDFSDDPTLIPGTTVSTTREGINGDYIASGEATQVTTAFFKLFNRGRDDYYIGWAPPNLHPNSPCAFIPRPPGLGGVEGGVEPSMRYAQGNQIYLIWEINSDENDLIYFRVKPDPGTVTQRNYTQTNTLLITQTTRTVTEGAATYEGNVRLSFTWNNLPMVVMSPIASIVLTLNGMTITPEIQPINITDHTGSSLTSTIPVIENYFSMAQSLRDLHDELVVVKDTFEDTATYTVTSTSGTERAVTISAKYITKDGSLHQIYIPPKGVFSLQLTFGLSFYIA